MPDKIKAAVIENVNELKFLEFDMPRPAAYEVLYQVKTVRYVQLNKEHM